MFKLLCIFLLLKLIQLVIVYYTPGRFDTSSEIITDKLTSGYNRVITTLLNKLITWDSVYFNDLFVNDYKFEHQYVFCPGWIQLVKYLQMDYYQSQLTSVLLSNLFHFLSVILLYLVTNEYDSNLSYFSSLLMILSPAGIFLTTNYLENLNNFLSLLTFYLYYKSVNFNDVNTKSRKSIRSVGLYIFSGISCGLAYTIRANSLFLGVIYLIDLYDFIMDDMISSLISIFTGSILFLVFIGSNIQHYMIFCPGRQWCSSFFPSLFMYAQSHYWDNGFLKYWTLNNVPNFLMALPVIIFNVYSINVMIKELPRCRKILPLIIINSLIIVGGVFFWNTQILNRITSFLPLQYWTLSTHRSRYVLYYMIGWNLIQTSLFAAFLPPA